MRTIFYRSMAALMVAACALVGNAQAGVMVDTKLSLVIDISGSVNTSEYNLQMDGYAAAFRTQAVKDIILNGPLGQVAVNTVFFATGATSPNAFTLLNSTASIDAFADTLDTFARPSGVGSSTHIGEGILQARTDLMNTADFESERLVMDISGDGTSAGLSVTAQRDLTAAAGITINGVAIGAAFLETYYADNVITPDGFVKFAAGFAEFSVAIDEKLRQELQGGGNVPEPNSMAIAMVLLAMGGLRSRRRRA